MRVHTHEDLDVYQRAFKAANMVFDLSIRFPKVESYSLTDQIRRSSRSVCANIAEAFSHRRYVLSFISKLTVVAAEAAETQVWLDFAVSCKYVDQLYADDIKSEYARIIKMTITMIKNAEDWSFSK